MSLIARVPETNETVPVPEGIWQAVCYGVVDLGTHYFDQFGRRARKVVIMWEVPEHRIEIARDGQERNLPRVISKRYTLSLHEKSALRKDLESWRGRKFTAEELNGFDLHRLLGANCMLQIVHEPASDGSGRVFARVAAVVQLPKAMAKRQAENEHQWFSFDEKTPIPLSIPSWMVEEIRRADEWMPAGEVDAGEEWPAGLDLPPGHVVADGEGVPF